MKSGSAANGRRSKQSQQHGAVGGDLYNIDDLTVREFFLYSMSKPRLQCALSLKQKNS